MATNNTIKESLINLITAMGGTANGSTINEVIDSLAEAIDDGDVVIEITQLDNLTDVTLTNPSNGQVLKYDATAGKWINGTDTDTDALEDLTDVDLTSPANGQVLIYNSTSQKWENGGIVGLPTVTADDNGKVLKVVNGVWTAVEETPAVEEIM